MAKTKELKKSRVHGATENRFRPFWKPSLPCERAALLSARPGPTRPSVVSRLRRDTRGCMRADGCDWDLASCYLQGGGPREGQVPGVLGRLELVHGVQAARRIRQRLPAAQKVGRLHRRGEAPAAARTTVELGLGLGFRAKANPNPKVRVRARVRLGLRLGLGGTARRSQKRQRGWGWRVGGVP